MLVRRTKLLYEREELEKMLVSLIVVAESIIVLLANLA
jgi:hypothetical protein